MELRSPIRAAALAAILAMSACGQGSTPPPPVGGPVDFTIDGLSFHMSSGGIFTNGQQFTLFFTDRPDTCSAVALIPQFTFLSLELKISPPADGSRTATIGLPSPIVFPPSGQAGGNLLQLTVVNVNQQVVLKDVPSASGTVTWRPNSNGTVTITLLDMGFGGTPDRIRSVDLTVPLCN